MKKFALLRLIETLDEFAPMTSELERELGIGVGFGSAWYFSQKEHWLRRLSEHDTPGAYGRRPNSGRNCEFIYNRLQCPPMVFWLGEALELPIVSLKAAYVAAMNVREHHATQTAAIRREIPWSLIEYRVLQCSERNDARCRGYSEQTKPCV